MEPWSVKLSQGETEAAWNLFIDRYRRLILATIRRTIDSDEDVLDVFAQVCQVLSANDLERLNDYRHHGSRRARFSTWLVTVVRNQTIDWVRRRDGRPRVTAPDALSPIQREIFRHIFVDQRSHAETFELVRGSLPGETSFGSFLNEVSETYRVVERTRARGAMRYFAALPETSESAESPEDSLTRSEIGARLAKALESLPSDQRLAVLLFVVEGLSADDVARVVGWPNSKAVYNRVYRTLTALRKELEREGVRPGDL